MAAHTGYCDSRCCGMREIDQGKEYETVWCACPCHRAQEEDAMREMGDERDPED